MRFSMRGLSLGLLGLSVILAGCGGKKASNEIVVGEFGSLTGAQSTFGTSDETGIALAVDELNKAGGINGKKVNVISEDDAGQPEQALNVVKRLITQEGAVAILGEVASKNSIAAAPFCNSSKVPMISPSSTNPKVTQQGPYIFRVCFIDPFQGLVGAKFAYNTLKARKAAVLFDSGGDYSVGLKDVFEASFKKLGGQIVAERDYQATDSDFRAQLTAIKAANPDVLYVPGYYSQIGPIAKQARAVGIPPSVPLLGGDGWESDKLVEGAGGPGGALEGSYFTNHSSMDSPDPRIQTFVTAYKAANNGQKPNALAALAYDAAGVLFAAMKQIPAPADGDYNTDAYRAKLRDAIAATKDYPGVTGNITLNADRNAVKPAVVLQIKGADEKYVTTINP